MNNEEITFGKISALKAYTDTKSYKEENSFKIKKIEFFKKKKKNVLNIKI